MIQVIGNPGWDVVIQRVHDHADAEKRDTRGLGHSRDADTFHVHGHRIGGGVKRLLVRSAYQGRAAFSQRFPVHRAAFFQ
jgi:hypothetical protein